MRKLELEPWGREGSSLGHLLRHGRKQDAMAGGARGAGSLLLACSKGAELGWKQPRRELAAEVEDVKLLSAGSRGRAVRPWREGVVLPALGKMGRTPWLAGLPASRCGEERCHG